MERIGWDPDEHSAERQMQTVLDSLNGPIVKKRARGKTRYERVRLSLSEQEVELRRLVDQWKLSGPNVRELFTQEPELEALSKRGKISFYPTDTGRGHLEWSPGEAIEGIASPKDVARQRFMMLITNPNWEGLGGPCIWCGDYFLKNVNRPRSYCSVKCSSRSTAIAAMKTKRQREHEEKLQQARSMIEKWESSGSKQDWRVWIACDVKFTVKWLTRAVNKGELQPPVRGQATRHGGSTSQG